jgi:hypothetical protein
MFELEAAFDRWRTQAVSSGITADTLAELGDHLRADVESHVARGRTAQEAWRLAIVKLGDPAALAPEFHKVERLSTLDRTAFGLILAIVTGLIAVALGLIAVRGSVRGDWLLTTHVVAITIGYGLGLAAAPAAVWCLARTLFASRPILTLSNAAIRLIRGISLFAAVSTILGVVLGALWAGREWNCYFTFNVRELGGLVIASSLIAAAYAATLQRHSFISLAIALASGGLIMGFWFGPIAYALGYPPLLTTFAFGGLALGLTLAVLTLAHFRSQNELSANTP